MDAARIVDGPRFEAAIMQSVAASPKAIQWPYARQPGAPQKATNALRRPSGRTRGLFRQEQFCRRSKVSQRFTLDRQSFEQFLAAVSLFQPLRQADAKKRNGEAPLLLYLLETLRDIDSGTLPLQNALERVAELALRIVGGDGAAVWLFRSEDLFCRAVAGASFEDDHIRTVLRSKLQSAGAFGDDPPAKLDLARTLADCLGGIGSWLVIALLPGGKIAGGLAVFSAQPAAFTSRDFVHLRLLAGLAQYVATTAPRPVPIEDLYLPGVATRAALGGDGDIDARSRLRTVLRERQERLTATMVGLASSAAGMARQGVVAGAKGLKRTASSIGQASKRSLTSHGKIPTSSSSNTRQVRSNLRLAAQSSAPSERPIIPLDRITKKLRRIRFLSLKRMGDAYDQVSSTWERSGRAVGAITRQFTKEAREEVRLWVAHWLIASVEVRCWVAQRFTASVSAFSSLRASAPEVRLWIFPVSSKSISLASSRLANEARFSRTRLQSFVTSAGLKGRQRMQRLRSATLEAGASTLRRVRNVDVNRPALQKAAPAIAILGVMLLFIVLQVAGRRPLAGSSLTSAAEVAPDQNSADNLSPKRAVTSAIPPR